LDWLVKKRNKKLFLLEDERAFPRYHLISPGFRRTLSRTIIRGKQ